MTEQPGTGGTAKSAIPADSFAHRLMLARAHAGHISIREAAEMTGFGRGAWTNWESKGTMPVDLEYVVEVISEKLGVDPVWLADGGALAEDETRSRRWSTLRPTHARRTRSDVEATGYKPQVTGQRLPGSTRPTSRGSSTRPGGGRPKGRGAASVPNPATRRPARVISTDHNVVNEIVPVGRAA